MKNITMIFYTLIIILIILKFLSFENFNSENKKIFIINLERDKKRLNIILDKSKNQNLNIIRFDAINGNNLLEHKSMIYKFFNPYTNLKNTQIGCFLSHLYLWKKITIQPDKYSIILEDDAIIPDNFYAKLKIYMNQLPNNWDMLILGGNSFSGTKYSKNLVKPVYTPKGNWGCFGYIIRKKFAEKILSECRNITIPVDKYLNENYYEKNQVFVCYPYLIKHNYDLYSNIFNRKRSSEREKREKINILN